MMLDRLFVYTTNLNTIQIQIVVNSYLKSKHSKHDNSIHLQETYLINVLFLCLKGE